jgi:transcriptional regulator with XRE-family HTH domain
MRKFGSWLLKELDKHDMSQSDLARACKITTAQMSRIVSGERNAGTETLTNIAHAFKLPVDLVFEKAGLLPPNSELSPTKRTLINLAKGLPDSDLEMVIALLEQRDDYYKKNPKIKPEK